MRRRVLIPEKDRLRTSAKGSVTEKKLYFTSYGRNASFHKTVFPVLWQMSHSWKTPNAGRPGAGALLHCG